MNRNHSSVRSNMVAAAGSVALIVCAMATNAFAAPPIDPSTTRNGNVSLAGLDLTQPEGLQIARARIRQQAVKLCTSLRDPLSLSHHEAFLECVDHVMGAAEPTLAQLATAQSPATKLASAQR